MISGNDMLTAGRVRALPLRERVGLVINAFSARDTLQTILAAEQAGVCQVWTTQGPEDVDALTVYTVAATQTSSIRMGTSILLTYPRHPLVVVAHARYVHELAPGRLRLGLGASHSPMIEGAYGLPMIEPLEHLREYLRVLRAALWEGKVDFHGRFIQGSASYRETSPVPLLMAALGKKTFHAAGELADGAISWVCPVNYLVQAGLPAMQAGADSARRPAPPLVAHVAVALSENRPAALAAGRKRLGYYGRLPFYQNMFAASGYPVPEDGSLPDALIDQLVISGGEAAVAARLSALLTESGISELLVQTLPVQDEAGERLRVARILGQL